MAQRGKIGRGAWSRVLLAAYILFPAATAAVLICEAAAGEWRNVWLCGGTFLLYAVPRALMRILRVDAPVLIEVLALQFAFSANILGEVLEFYVRIDLWDTLLHLESGFFCGALGLMLVNVLNGSDVTRKLSPAAIAALSFASAVTIGVLWEFVEYFMDSVFLTDMQKDVYIDAVNSVLLQPEGRNFAVSRQIESVVINGEAWAGYIDIGLHDTMGDLLTGALGSALYGAAAFFCARTRRHELLERLIPRRRP